MKLLTDLFMSFTVFITAIFGHTPTQAPQQFPSDIQTEVVKPASTFPVSTKTDAYSDDQILALADNKYAGGNVPLGNNLYVTDAPKKGYIYLCHVQKEGGGSQTAGPWISGKTWNFLKKISVSGNVSWPNATFTNTLSGTNRILKGNGLPVTHKTGVFPIAATDPAYAYDHNPNSISAQSFMETVPASPVYSDTPYCMGGEVGVMLSGVPLFNGFDAELRDAPANELQDSCDGHPQVSGEYHYHGLSRCFTDISVKTVLGYALDGFPITGPLVAAGKYLTTEDLDQCHGITSTITVNGQPVTTYHYVMTQDFPYSVSCFRGKPSTPSGQTADKKPGGQTGTVHQPPQQAIAACENKMQGDSCQFNGPSGTINGVCETPPGSTLACVPH